MDLSRKHRRHRQAKLKRQKDIGKTSGKGMVSDMKFDDYLQEQLKDPDFKKEWNDIQPEMDVIRAIIDAREEQNLTQKELAEKVGMNQADISKLENGTRNPSLKLLKKLATGLGMELKIQFVKQPKNMLR